MVAAGVKAAVVVGHRWWMLIVTACVVAVLAGCGGGGDKTQAVGTTGETVERSRLAEKIGLIPVGSGEYRLGGCTAAAVLSSRQAIARERKAGKEVVMDPTGAFGIETEDRARCVELMKEAVAVLNVP
jgi:hypothetical protein